MKATRLLLATCALPIAAFATPSGLNNIPTADTTPQGTFVLQGFTTLGSDRDADFNLGFKTGVDIYGPLKLELGLAAHISPGKGGPVTGHGKLAYAFGDGLPTVAIGAANSTVSSEYRDRAGDDFFYAVVSQDFGWFRAHAGVASQDSETLPFFGVDKTFRMRVDKPAPADGKSVRGADGKSSKSVIEPEYRDLFTLRADVIAQRDSSWLYSVGVLVPLHKYFVLETWANLPDNGDEPSVTIKGNIVLRF